MFNCIEHGTNAKETSIKTRGHTNVKVEGGNEKGWIGHVPTLVVKFRRETGTRNDACFEFGDYGTGNTGQVISSRIAH